MFRSLRPWSTAFHALRSSQSQAGPPRRPRRRPARRCLPLEQLEGRLVLSTLHVSTLADGGAGSLRDAVAQANAHTGADVVVFNDGLAGTIALTGGELDITDDLKINGPGADELTVSGSNLSRVFKVEAGETVSISGLTIAGGHPDSGSGGGIDNFGTLTVSDSVFSGNSVSVVVVSGDSTSFPDGGGLKNEIGGTATVRGSTFTNNTASHFGGGISNSGTLTVSDSTFTGNSSGFGGGISNIQTITSTGIVPATLTVSDSTFTGNSTFTGIGTSAFGGGLGNGIGGTATVSDSTFTSNSAVKGGGLDNGGALTVSGSTFTGNSAVFGGGLENGGTATVSGSTFTSNTAGRFGGGLDNDVAAEVTVSDSTFTGNSAVFGGGLANGLRGTATVIGSTFTDNSATIHGGGIDNFGGTMTVSSSTFRRNTATSGNGGLNNDARGLLTQFDNRFIDDQAPDIFP